ncbi:GntR family transcriptional regulator [Nesterenkonia sp. MY13]|uniref:GntR family transcriptional regulator n=1 Tax=Nesterenkonia sedimenti TaxID=1463632 RepID=A0A7X8YDH5_9MICC|nr:GntR family transcriptional regulator [Nesterenkonia sedimenti]NLS09445.1 GntR family transcriptional regulator [Nesterenkonia sedimenti]
MPVPNTAPLTRRSLLRDDVYRAVRDAIVRGELAPGEKLVDSQLQEWLGVSRTPIREALLRLERSGLVSAVPGRSTMVTPYDTVAVGDSRVVAAELHSLAARLAVPQLEAADFNRLTEANEALRKGVEAGDAEACVTADDAFHGIFIHRGGNAVLTEQIDQVMPVLRRAEYLHFDSARALTSISHHEQIIAAAQAGDATGCAELTQQNWLALSEG